MHTVEIELSNAAIDVEASIEDRCEAAGLRQIMKSGLAAYPGCTHWHYKQGDGRGVLKITWWPREGRAWLSVHDNRSADWIDELLPDLKSEIEATLVDGATA